MIHINRNGVHTGGRTMNTMCTRRHRGMMQTSVILILFVCIGYGFYLYNLLQIQMTEVDSRASRYRAQHQSLSEQLQVVYDERTQLEKSLQNEKDDHSNTKQEFIKHKEDVQNQQEKQMLEHQREKEKLAEDNNKLMNAANVHREKYDGLIQDHEAVVEQHNTLQRQHEQFKISIEEKLQNEKNDRLLLENSHNELQQQHAIVQEEANKLKEQISGLNQLSEMNENNVASTQQKLDQQVQLYNQLQKQLSIAIESHKQETDALADQLNVAQADADKYNSLGNVLRVVGVDVVNLEHEKVKQLPAEDRKLLFEHLGGSENANLIEEQHVQLAREEEERLKAIQEKERTQKLRDEQLKLRQEQQQAALDQQNMPRQTMIPQAASNEQQDANTVEEGNTQHDAGDENEDEGNVMDICALPVEVGNCDGNMPRYYFDPQQAVCRTFTYTGCQGNENNFESLEVCEDTCSDDNKRYIVQESQQGLTHENSRDMKDEDAGEMEARSLEEQAKKEFEAQQQMQDPENLDAVEQLKELQEEQVKAAKEQEDNMNQFIEQGRKSDNVRGENEIDSREVADGEEDTLEQEGGAMDYEEDAAEHDSKLIQGEIVEEGNENNYNMNGVRSNENAVNAAKTKEGDAQVALPPAAQVAGDNPEEVANIPPLNPDEQEEENQGETEQYDEDYEEDENEPAGQEHNIQAAFPRHQLDGDGNEAFDYREDGQEQEDDYQEEQGRGDSRYQGPDTYNNADNAQYAYRDQKGGNSNMNYQKGGNNNMNYQKGGNNNMNFQRQPIQNFNIRNRDF